MPERIRLSATLTLAPRCHHAQMLEGGSGPYRVSALEGRGKRADRYPHGLPVCPFSGDHVERQVS